MPNKSPSHVTHADLEVFKREVVESLNGAAKHVVQPQTWLAQYGPLTLTAAVLFVGLVGTWFTHAAVLNAHDQRIVAIEMHYVPRELNEEREKAQLARDGEILRRLQNLEDKLDFNIAQQAYQNGQRGMGAPVSSGNRRP